MKKIFAVMAACLLLCGCVVGSLSPFYTDNLIVAQPALNGSWYFTEDIDAHDESPLVFADGKMTIYDDKGVPADAKATFFKVDDTIFLDIFADQGRLRQDVSKDQAPVHLLSRVKILGPDKISFNALDLEWLGESVQAGNIKLPYKKTAPENVDIVFTATPAQWVEFLRQHKDDPKLFPLDKEACLVRKAVSSQ